MPPSSPQYLVALVAFLPLIISTDARRQLFSSLASSHEADADSSAFWARQLGTSYPSSSSEVAYTDRILLQRKDKQHPLQRNGVNLFLRESTNNACTNRESDAATDMLLIHSLTYSSHEYDVQYKDYSLVNRLLQECKTVWSLDIAGYGRSSPVSDGFEIDTDYAADDISAAIQYITSRRSEKSDGEVFLIDMLGWSWGTNTITRYIENQSADHNVRRAVLIAPLINAFDGNPDELSDFHANNWEHATSDFQVDADGSVDFQIAEPGAVYEFLSNCWQYDQNSSPNGGRCDLLAGSDVQLFDPSQIDVPVFFVGGSEDPLKYFDLLEEGFDMLPRKEESKKKIFDGAGHIIFLVKSYYRKFQDAVVDFEMNIRSVT